MQCPSCGAAIPDSSTRCEFCHRPVAATVPQRGIVPRPQKFHIEDDGISLHIWWRWFHPMVFFLVPFAVAWNAFLLGWYGMASAMGDMPGPMRFVFLVFPIGHVAVGVGLAYVCLAMLVNRSRVVVDRGVLTVSHGPLPWPGATLNAEDIDQIYCAEGRAANKDSTPTYQVQAQLKDASVKTLLSGVSDRSEALYLEQAIEQHLRISDAAVVGELPRS